VTASILIPLLGVAIGAAGALLSQYFSNRLATQQSRVARSAAIREERKGLILAFLETAQTVEQAAEHLYQNGSRPDDTVSRTHRMWFRQKCIELACSAELNDRAIDYSWRMHEACYKDLPKGMPVWDYIAEKRNPFLAAARTELGIAEL
jgi:hypothetical protein